MPIYEYECKSCHHRFEVKQNIAEEPIKVCPGCEGEVRRVIQPVGIVFKGSGWYVTDHGKGSVAAAKAEETSAPETSKPAEKKETVPVASGTGDNKKTD